MLLNLLGIEKSTVIVDITVTSELQFAPTRQPTTEKRSPRPMDDSVTLPFNEDQIEMMTLKSV